MLITGEGDCKVELRQVAVKPCLSEAPGGESLDLVMLGVNLLVLHGQELLDACSNGALTQPHDRLVRRWITGDRPCQCMQSSSIQRPHCCCSSERELAAKDVVVAPRRETSDENKDCYHVLWQNIVPLY